MYWRVQTEVMVVVQHEDELLLDAFQDLVD